MIWHYKTCIPFSPQSKIEIAQNSVKLRKGSSICFHHFLTKIKGAQKTLNPLIFLVIVSGFEPLAYRLGGGRSIQLSYTISLRELYYNTILTPCNQGLQGSSLVSPIIFIPISQLTLDFIASLAAPRKCPYLYVPIDTVRSEMT